MPTNPMRIPVVLALSMSLALTASACANVVEDADPVAAAVASLMPNTWNPSQPLAVNTAYWVEAEGSSTAPLVSVIDEDGTMYTSGGCAIAIMRATEALEHALDSARLECRLLGGELWIGASTSAYPGPIELTGDALFQLPSQNACSARAGYWHSRAAEIFCGRGAFVDIPGELQWCGDTIDETFTVTTPTLPFEQYGADVLERAQADCRNIPGGIFGGNVFFATDSQTHVTTMNVFATCSCGVAPPRRDAETPRHEGAIGWAEEDATD